MKKIKVIMLDVDVVVVLAEKFWHRNLLSGELPRSLWGFGAAGLRLIRIDFTDFILFF